MLYILYIMCCMLYLIKEQSVWAAEVSLFTVDAEEVRTPIAAEWIGVKASFTGAIEHLESRQKPRRSTNRCYKWKEKLWLHNIYFSRGGGFAVLHCSGYSE